MVPTELLLEANILRQQLQLSGIGTVSSSIARLWNGIYHWKMYDEATEMPQRI